MVIYVSQGAANNLHPGNGQWRNIQIKQLLFIYLLFAKNKVLTSPQYNNNDIQPVPRVSEIRVGVKNESHGDNLQQHFNCVYSCKHVPVPDCKNNNSCIRFSL